MVDRYFDNYKTVAIAGTVAQTLFNEANEIWSNLQRGPAKLEHKKHMPYKSKRAFKPRASFKFSGARGRKATARRAIPTFRAKPRTYFAKRATPKARLFKAVRSNPTAHALAKLNTQYGTARYLFDTENSGLLQSLEGKGNLDFCDLGNNNYLRENQVAQMFRQAPAVNVSVSSELTSQQPNSLWVERFDTLQTFTNMSTAQCTLTIYEAVLRQDFSPNDEVTGIAAIPGLAIDAVGADIGVPANGITSLQDPNLTPFDLPFLCSMFKITKTVKRVMAPGAVWNYHRSFKGRYIFKASGIDEDASGSAEDAPNFGSVNARRGMAKFQIYTLKGSTMLGTAVQSGGTVGHVTLSPASVAYISKAKFWVRFPTAQSNPYNAHLLNASGVYSNDAYDTNITAGVVGNTALGGPVSFVDYPATMPTAMGPPISLKKPVLKRNTPTTTSSSSSSSGDYEMVDSKQATPLKKPPTPTLTNRVASIKL